MDSVNNILTRRINNVNVDNNINNNVNVEELVRELQGEVDKPNALAEILVKQLEAPQNKRFYLKLAREYPIETLFKCLALTKEASRDGLIRTSKAQYFYGIVKRQKNEK